MHSGGDLWTKLSFLNEHFHNLYDQIKFQIIFNGIEIKISFPRALSDSNYKIFFKKILVQLYTHRLRLGRRGPKM
jgi:hypothetical protein